MTAFHIIGMGLFFGSLVGHAIVGLAVLFIGVLKPGENKL